MKNMALSKDELKSTIENDIKLLRIERAEKHHLDGILSWSGAIYEGRDYLAHVYNPWVDHEAR